jgi:hypothetical protein
MEELGENSPTPAEIFEDPKEESIPVFIENFSNSSMKDEIPFVEEIIIPTDDSGPRFVETLESPEIKPIPVPPKDNRPHPRNIPKFTRLAK